MLFCFKKILVQLLTAKVKTLIKNVQAAKNHWNLQTDNGVNSSSLFIASKLTIEMGITTMETAKSLNPILTMRLFPAWINEIFFKNDWSKICDKDSFIMSFKYYIVFTWLESEGFIKASHKLI